MAFNIALSGIRAASIDLEVTGNNIANASTTGFKESRAEFSDVYANSMYGYGAIETGDGVQVANVAQNFTQGNLAYTENELDIAINGQGFFVMRSEAGISYTRDGAFGLDSDGYVVNSSGVRLQGYPSDGQDGVSGVIDDLRVQTQNIEPQQTARVDWSLNLDANADPIDPAIAFSPDDPSSYNNATPVTIHDAQGNEHVLTQFFVKTQTANEWQVYTQIDDQLHPNPNTTPAPPIQTITFESTGELTPGTPPLTITNWSPANATDTERDVLTINFPNATQYSSQFTTSSVDQDGYNTGRVSGLEIDRTGNINARFSNGQSKLLGQITLAEFDNVQGLDPVGGNAWVETFASGEPAVGVPGSSSRGLINSGALEESNVDLTEELVQLILSQRNFQANSKTIETVDQVTQTMINLR